MHAIFRTFYGAPTGDMNNILMSGITSRERLEKVVREHLADKYSKCPECDKPKVDEIIIEYRPDEEVYPYVVSYLTHGDDESHLLGSINIPFYDEKDDITSTFPTRDLFYQDIALKKYERALTSNLTGIMLFWFLRSNKRDEITSVKTKCLHAEFEHLDDQDIWELYRVCREYKLHVDA